MGEWIYEEDNVGETLHNELHVYIKVYISDRGRISPMWKCGAALGEPYPTDAVSHPHKCRCFLAKVSPPSLPSDTTDSCRIEQFSQLARFSHR